MPVLLNEWSFGYHTEIFNFQFHFSNWIEHLLRWWQDGIVERATPIEVEEVRLLPHGSQSSSSMTRKAQGLQNLNELASIRPLGAVLFSINFPPTSPLWRLPLKPNWNGHSVTEKRYHIFSKGSKQTFKKDRINYEILYFYPPNTTLYYWFVIRSWQRSNLIHNMKDKRLSNGSLQ